MDIPFYIDAAPYLGAALMALGVIPGVLVARWRTRRACREEGERRFPMAPRGLDDASPDEVRELVGTLEAEGTVEAFVSAEPVAVSTVDLGSGDVETMPARQTERLWVRVGDRSIPIEGDVRCALGSTELRSGQPLRQLPRSKAILRWLPERRVPLGVPRASTLNDGDRVRVVGTLETRAAPEGEAYRDNASDWALVPSDDEGVVWIAADETSRVHGPSVPRQVVGGLLSASTAAVLIYANAAALFSGPVVESDELPWRRPWLVTAALSPFHTEEVSEWMQRAYRPPVPRTRETGEIEVALTARLGCVSGVRAARARGLDETAMALAEECDPRERVMVHCAAGRYAEAARVEGRDPLARERREVVLRLLAGEDEAAEHATREWILAERRDEHSPHSPEILSCIADAIAARRDDPAARERLRAAARSSGVCAALLADASAPDERASILTTPCPDDARCLHEMAKLALLAEASPTAAADTLVELDRPLLGLLRGTGTAWLSPPLPGLTEALTRVDAEAPDEPEMLALRAALRLLRVDEVAGLGELEAAERLLDSAFEDVERARTLLTPSPEPPPPEVNAADPPPDDAPAERPITVAVEELRIAAETWRVTLALETEQPDEADAALEALPEEARAQLNDLMESYPSPVHRQYPTLDSASHDGRRLAERLRPNRWIEPELALTAARRATTHRAALASELRWSPFRGISETCDPMMALHRLAYDRRLARILADEEWRALVRERIRAHDSPMRRREIAVLLHVLLENRYIYG